KLSIDLNESKIEELKQWYVKTYTDLAKHYLDKKDATLFLENFAKKESKYFMPNDSKIKAFVEFYFNRYKEIGQELDKEDKKSNYIK
ncbi:MAG: CiaB protein, partial [Halarcobacter sp.]